MSSQNEEEKILMPHHVQQPLCTTRLAYRQGRIFTAVKVYTINDESTHLLIFGVPSLNLRQETKSLCSKFGRVLQLHLTPKYPTEPFTETYHVLFEKIQCARIAKKMLDGKNFYGGVLHVCYAPELETIEEVRTKLMQRKRDVYFRLKKNEHDNKIKEVIETKTINDNVEIDNEVKESEKKDTETELKTEVVISKPPVKMNMGHVNVISFGKKRKKKVKEKVTKEKKIKETDIIDCTSVEKDTITNIYEALNNKIEIRSIQQKPLNKIEFFNNK
ncbi:RNA-binding protein 48 [Manduca sexta]|uniref:RNA-binding protein 48 n=1 Tax=Manduca sexta TaxID=7130 RepID=UPI00188EF1BA|nr:RNA-binding protein 48 [Manduca sexta]